MATYIKLNNGKTLYLTNENIDQLNKMPQTTHEHMCLSFGGYSISHDGKGNYMVEKYIKSMGMNVPRGTFRLTDV